MTSCKPKRPKHTISHMAPYITKIVFDTGVEWVVIGDEHLNHAFHRAMRNMQGMDTTQECLMRANWMGSLATIFHVEHVTSFSSWKKYLQHD